MGPLHGGIYVGLGHGFHGPKIEVIVQGWPGIASLWGRGGRGKGRADKR